MAQHILDSRSCCWKIRSAKEQPGLVSCTMNCCEFQPRLRVSGASPGTGGCWCLFGSDSQMKSVCSWNSSTSLSPSGCVQEQRTAQMPQSYPWHSQRCSPVSRSVLLSSCSSFVSCGREEALITQILVKEQKLQQDQKHSSQMFSLNAWL